MDLKWNYLGKVECREINKKNKAYFNTKLIQLKKRNVNLVYRDTGLFVSRSFLPYLAATTIGEIKCSCCGTGLVESKWTFTHRRKSNLQVANESNYHLYFENDKMKLKKVFHGSLESRHN